MTSEEIEKLKLVKNKFNEQMSSNSSQLKEFHKQLIYLGSKHPEQTEILEFIVFINDRMDTSISNSNDIVVETLNETITIIQKHIEGHKPESDKKTFSFKDIFSKISTVKDLKMIMVFVIIILALAGYLISPEGMFELIDAVMKLAKLL